MRDRAKVGGSFDGDPSGLSPGLVFFAHPTPTAVVLHDSALGDKVGSIGSAVLGRSVGGAKSRTHYLFGGRWANFFLRFFDGHFVFWSGFGHQRCGRIGGGSGAGAKRQGRSEAEAGQKSDESESG
jgi:hypothetical protein